jgi:hypothetical protein
VQSNGLLKGNNGLVRASAGIFPSPYATDFGLLQ